MEYSFAIPGSAFQIRIVGTCVGDDFDDIVVVEEI